ncbi:hypothetical protein LCGC14_1453120, partial [marine sediment metagenome]
MNKPIWLNYKSGKTTKLVTGMT